MTVRKFSTIRGRRDETTGNEAEKMLLQKSVRSYLWLGTGNGLFLPHAVIPVSGRDYHCGAGHFSRQTQSVNLCGRDLHENRFDRSSKSAWFSASALF